MINEVLHIVRYHVPTQKLKLIGGRPKQVYEVIKLITWAMWDVGLSQHSPSRAGPTNFMDGPATWATQERRDRNPL